MKPEKHSAAQGPHGNIGRRTTYGPVAAVVTQMACHTMRRGAATGDDLATAMRLYGVPAERTAEVERELRRVGLGLARRPSAAVPRNGGAEDLVAHAFTRTPSRRAAARLLVRRCKEAWRQVLLALFRHREARREAVAVGQMILAQRSEEAAVPPAVREEDFAFAVALEEVQVELENHRQRLRDGRLAEQANANANANADAEQAAAADADKAAATRTAATLATYARPRMVIAAWQAARRTRDPSLAEPEWRGTVAQRIAEFETEREMLALAFEGLVLALVRRMPATLRDEADTVAAGLDGIRKAIEYFDPDADYEFQTYALHWVRRALGRLVTGPATQGLHEMRAALRAELGREPSPSELVWASGAPLDEVRRLLRKRDADVDRA